jgi:DNA-binding transcriptional LysR family regulator
MDLRRLRTLIAIADAPSFTAAGEVIGLSHSAVSLHVKELEAELGLPLVDRTRRPPRLTERGLAVVDQARRMVDIAEDIRALGTERSLVGALSVGIVPTAMAGLAPPALARLRKTHPRLRVAIRTGLSGDLAALVRAGSLDAALVTSPDPALPGLRIREAAREPLEVIAPPETPAGEAAALLIGRPFIWFSRATWAGQQIERHLARKGIAVDAAMEVDSLEAIEALVRHGLGVSVVPRRRGAPRTGLRVTALDDPPLWRCLSLVERPHHPRARFTDALFEALTTEEVSQGGTTAEAPSC